MEVQDLEAEWARLVFRHFDEADALALGLVLVELARTARHPVAIDIRTPDRTLFHAAMPGSKPLNALWARRKSACALLFQEPSLLTGARHRAKGEDIAVHGVDPAAISDSGGSVPVRVAGIGVVAAVTVSGLPQAEDHALVVGAMERMIAAQG
ncbi:MAG: heme-binding protein [Rhodobacteraceae bacterium]|nr:heme-binding protein [Paracoccaceae bacterium]